jgi:hypothetical protein
MKGALTVALLGAGAKATAAVTPGPLYPGAGVFPASALYPAGATSTTAARTRRPSLVTLGGGT